jgi:uncharacterized membrane protein YfcA
MEWVITSLIGLLGGVLSGMFGIGGGVVIVPMLILLLGYGQHRAQGTSLAVLLPPIGILGVMNYWRAGHVELRSAALIAAGFILGGYVGSKITLALPAATVRKAFAVVLILLAVQLLLKKDVPAAPAVEASPAGASGEATG